MKIVLDIVIVLLAGYLGYHCVRILMDNLIQKN